MFFFQKILLCLTSKDTYHHRIEEQQRILQKAEDNESNSFTFVPNSACPLGRTEILTSQRSEPSCIFPLHTPKYLTNLCNSAPYSAASMPLLISGSETISSNGTPALFRSTCRRQVTYYPRSL